MRFGMVVEMKNLRKTIFALFGFALVMLSQASEYVLYWQIDENATIGDVSLNDYSSWYAQANNNFDVGGNSGRIAGARAVAYSGDEMTIMTIGEYNGSTWVSIVPAESDVFIVGDDDRTIVGTGGLYSHLTITDPVELSFAIELGNWENGEWVTLASSDKMSYLSLAGQLDGSRHVWGPGDTHNLADYQPWSPHGYAVPEPSTSLLGIIGLGLLLLKRKTNG